MSKWYLDCTTPSGDACIVYWGRVAIGPVGLVYASVVELAGEGPATERKTILGCTEPVVDDDRIGVVLDGLGVRGRWVAEADRIGATLLDTARGEVRWSCVAPRSEAEVLVGERAYLGEGYVERLEMTIAPWGLPIRELRWGRAIAGGVSAVWIEWAGPAPRRDVWVNGRLAAGCSVRDDLIEADGLRIELAAGRVVREGSIGATALAGIPALRAVVPAAMLDTREIKWVSRARVTSERARGARVFEGWAIHERVALGVVGAGDVEVEAAGREGASR